MRLIALHIENFMGLVGDHSLELDGLGLVHVAGNNRDDPANNSNGSGKSTILEALTWCLFGEGLPRPQGNTEQGVRANEVLNDHLNKQCRVVAELSEGDQTIRVERWRKWKPDKSAKQSNGQRLAVNGRFDEALDEKETNRLIEQALGITREIWCRGVVFGQESGFNFCDATTKQRAEILTTVMGLGEIDQWHDRCRDEKRALTNKLAEIDGRLGALRNEHDRLTAEQPEQRVRDWESDRSRRLSNAETHRSEIEAYGRQLSEQLANTPPIPDAVHALSIPPEVEQPYRAAEQELHRAKAELSAAGFKYAEAQRVLDGITTFNAQSHCPTCRQPISEQHKAACEDRARADLLAAMGVADAAKAAVARAESTREHYSSAYQSALRAVTESSSKARQVQSDRDRALNAISVLKSKINVARANWQNADRSVQAIASEINPHLSYQAEHQRRIEANETQLSACEAEQARIAKALDVCLWWDKELPRFRTWMFDSIVDVLAGEANRWLNIMSGGVMWIQISTTKQVGKRLKDELDVQIFRWNPDGSITSRTYRVWSGGEKRRVALAVDLGLSRLMAQRASKAYRFIALDEVDRHLDDRGKDGLRAVLDELRDDKETVITITHDPAFRASFDSEVVVTKANGKTRMEITRDGRANTTDRA